MTQKIKVTFILHFTNLKTKDNGYLYSAFYKFDDAKGKGYLYSALYKFDDTKGKGYLSQSAQANSNNRNWASLVLSCEVRLSVLSVDPLMGVGG